MKIHAVDLFCGVGGLTCGVQKAGINVIAGYDIDQRSKFAYQYNNGARFILKDVRDIDKYEINELYPGDTEVRILMGCAPCQPFSSYTKKHKKNNNLIEKMDLLHYFGEQVCNVQPEIVSIENVPQMQKESIFKEFVTTLASEGYSIDYKIVFAPDYGVPQKRKRLILLASKLGEIKILPPQITKEHYLTVRDAIGDLPPLHAGEINDLDPLHRCRNLSKLNMERIKQSKPGGTWKDWDEKLLLEAYKKKSGQSFGSVYGRLEWDKPANTITTQFLGIGNGRFGHPEQNRALSLREGALLQTFPKEYMFVDPECGDSCSVEQIALQIGNAVPPKLGEIIGTSILSHLKEVNL